MNTPTPGRIVLYVLPADHNHAGEIRPAIVVQNWSPHSETPCLNLHAFIDPANDDPLAARHQCSVDFGSEMQPRTWHWPPRA